MLKTIDFFEHLFYNNVTETFVLLNGVQMC